MVWYVVKLHKWWPVLPLLRYRFKYVTLLIGCVKAIGNRSSIICWDYLVIVCSIMVIVYIRRWINQLVLLCKLALLYVLRLEDALVWKRDDLHAVGGVILIYTLIILHLIWHFEVALRTVLQHWKLNYWIYRIHEITTSVGELHFV